ncbi:hypothetical protein Tco_1029908 [Tanacetum coccineum]|uniref:Transmembrane protein n=1 Tax=Tanacetum coccineum TaxID=301880 RepID=A0ABQ5G4R0_9ASTR
MDTKLDLSGTVVVAISDLILLVRFDVSEGEESDTWTEVTEADKKERRLEGEDLGKEEGGPTRVTWMGMVMWREVREEGVSGDGDEERAFFKELVRWRKVSLDDWGSWWDCWERKESRPRIGVEVTVVIRRSMVVKMVVVVVILGVELTMVKWGSDYGQNIGIFVW